MYKDIFFNNLHKFEVIKNNKTPSCKWTNANNHKKNIDLNKYNVGIPTGKINNIIVLDVDKKDDGINEFNNYIKQYGDINTLTVKTPNDGLHLYFLYKHSNDTVQHLIDESLINKTKYRNKGLDIRSNGGYIVGPNSSINNKQYDIIKQVDVIEMPENLALWLLEGCNNIKKNKNINNNPIIYNANNYKYIITDDEINNILNKLDDSYFNNYDKWLIVLTVLKNLNKFDIFNSFSKKSNKYNYENNVKLWNYNKGFIDINYLIKRINKEQKSNLSIIERVKLLSENIIDNNIKNISFNKEFIDIDNNIFNLYDTIIIQSDTGTGKTTHIAKQLNRYIKNTNNKYQIISIVNLINLANQQLKTFNDADIKLISYKDENKNINNDHIVICINSLLIFNYMSDDFFKDKILYIDEINSFLENLTMNDLLNKNIKIIYEILIKIIKKSHKIIFSDAHIKNNVFDFIKFRNNDTKIFIKNEYNKYKNINAICVKDENLFINKLLDSIKNNNLFLFGCDSCSVITKLYYKCIKEYKNKEKDFILITSENPFILTDANKQFKNKWVFYSPSIITGVDFSIDVKQDHFIYVKGNTINPTSIYQQSTRNRNINNLYYYFESKQHDFIYNSLEDVKTFYKNMIKTNDLINNVCRQFNENDDTYIIENTFFNLFCFNEYNNDCYNTNKKSHFENILINKGFILKTEGDNIKISNDTNKELNILINSVDIIKEYLNDTNDNKSLNIKYEQLCNSIQFFNLKEDDLLLYKGILTDKFERLHYFNFIKMLQTDDKIDTNIRELNNSSYEIKLINTIENKINIIKKIYNKHKIKYLSLDEFDKINKIDITNDEYDLIKYLFRTTKSKPINNDEFKKMVLGILKNLISNLGIIDIKRCRNNYTKNIFYSWNNIKIKYYIDFYKKYNNSILFIFY